MNKIKNLIIYIVFIAIAYYLVPAIANAVPAISSSNVLSYIVFLLTPILLIIISLVRGIHNGIDILYLIVAYAVFVPQIVIAKGSVFVIIYGVIYLLFCFIGLYVGSSLKGFKEGKDKK